MLLQNNDRTSQLSFESLIPESALQQKESRAVFYVDDYFLPSVLCKPVYGSFSEFSFFHFFVVTPRRLNSNLQKFKFTWEDLFVLTLRDSIFPPRHLLSFVLHIL